MRAFALALLAVCAVPCFAQAPPTATEVTLKFAASGGRKIWIQAPADLGREPAGAQDSKEAVFKLTVPQDATEDGLILVHDLDTARMASKPLAEAVKAGGWTVKAADEKYLAELRVTVYEGSEPAKSALVEAKVGSQARTALVGPADGGVAVLRLVPFGEATITATLKTASGETRLDPVKVGVTRDARGLEVTLRGPANPSGARAGTQPESQSEPKSDKPVFSPLPGFVNTLFGLIVVGGIVAGVVWLVKRNPKGVEEKLAQLGVGPVAPSDDAPPPPAAPPPPEPMKPIVLDDAPPPPTAMAAAVPVPRLVRADGSVVMLADGTTKVGREVGNDVVLGGGGSVSRHHAAIETAGGQATLTDLGSTNGTFVNGQRLSGPVVLRPGDAVMFGSEAFRYEA